MANKSKAKEILLQNNSITIDSIHDPIKVEITKATKQKEKFINKYGLTILSTIISIFALLFSIYQADKIREHNKLSVTPILQFSYINYTENNDFQIKIKNKGTGPAIIDNLIFISKSNKVFTTKDLHGAFWYTIFKVENIPDSITNKNLGHFYLDFGSAVSVGEDIDLFYIKTHGLSNQDYQRTINLISNCSLYIEYHSIYKTTYKDSLVFSANNYIEFKK